MGTVRDTSDLQISSHEAFGLTKVYVSPIKMMGLQEAEIVVQRSSRTLLCLHGLCEGWCCGPPLPVS